ncbi:TPA: hypothetical protein N0F65_008652 [Lagenidium giganteum]|uniref:Peptidase S74 domain-containing protein n=1 Tax=Lagenidium giganteum TaxID=4803 RepID=A0AAV2Z644_9STRA|nr:TPA: hypothetical protein N0F65_008652 [Lagenidium giganteum]
MSGFSYPNPSYISSIYNPAFYSSLDASGYLTYAYVQSLYLSKNDYRLSYLTSITAGTASPSLALVLDASKNITGINSLSCTSLTGTLITASQPNITSLGTLTGISCSGNISGTLTTAAQPNITSVGALTSTLSLSKSSSTQQIVFNNGTSNDFQLQTNNVIRMTILSGGNVGIGQTSPSYKLDVNGSLNSTSFYMSGTQVTATAADINQIAGITAGTAGITPGTAAASKALVLDASRRGIMGLGTSDTNCLRFYGNTANRETMNLYRVDDTTGSFTGGVSATSADLFNITWNDKPSVGFTSQTHRFCFNIGNTQPYKSGYPHTYALATSADAFAINVAGSSPTPSSACLYLVSDTINKMMFNTNTPYSGTYGTAPITLKNGNVYIKASNALNDGSSSFDMPLFVESSNASPVSFAFQLSNGANTTSTNAAYLGTTTNNDLRFMTNNSTSAIVTAAGRVGIGITSPNATLDVSGSVSSTIDISGLGVAYFLKSGGLVSTIGPLSSIGVSIKASNAILAGAGVYTTSDARIKKDFAPVDDSVVEGMLNVEPVLYRYKNQDESIPLQLGYKAQDLIRNGLPHCINYVEVEKLPIDDKETDLENVQYSVDYSKMCCLLHKVILEQQRQINKLTGRIDNLESK